MTSFTDRGKHAAYFCETCNIWSYTECSYSVYQYYSWYIIPHLVAFSLVILLYFLM